MGNDELERRIDILEQDVEALTEALRSALEWTASLSTLRNHGDPRTEGVSVHIQGREQTKEILDRLP